MSEFDNINGIYAKDVTLREGIATLRNTVTSQTIKPLTVTQNGTYTADPSEGTYGYSPVTVDVQEQPWQPLEDGYSNFWFELTNDTLSPWLNFSAKTEDAVIDWGDGTGEVALDTLTPTHTYAKAGKYVVKVKGVTGIARQHEPPYNGAYMRVLKYIETSSELATFVRYAFTGCVGLSKVSIAAISTIQLGVFQNCAMISEISLPSNMAEISSGTFTNCISIETISIPSTVSAIGATAFSSCAAFASITIPAAVTSIGNSAFNGDVSLSIIHIQATATPTLGTNVFQSLPSDFIIYIPVGYGETYKAAAGWSNYADHILEEGQTPNRAMLLAKFNGDNTDTEEMR